MRHFIRVACGLALVIALGTAACKKKNDEGDKAGLETPPTGPVTVVGDSKDPGRKPDSTPPAPHPTAGASVDAGPAEVVEDIQSKDILARTETSPETLVKHVLVAWKDLAPTYQGRMDPRAAARSHGEAARLAKEILAKLVTGASIDGLTKQYGEDPGQMAGEPYKVTSDAQFVPEFKAMGLRLKLNEAGIVQTQFGYHVMQRVAPPPPDAAESADILARKNTADFALVKHILIAWKDLAGGSPRPLDARATARSKDDAVKLVQSLLKQARGKADFDKLMAQYSEDQGTAASAHAYEIAPGTPMPDPFKNLALRLKVGEVGVVKTPFGYHVIKRVPPPPPDALESHDILARKPVTQQASVKHILLGWDKVNAGDPRATARSRGDLEKLVKDTVAKLKKGDKIEPLMTTLSEDPGSAKTGDPYPVTPGSQFVEPFKALALRLNLGEVGVVKSDFGIHIMQRVQ